jgi:acyl carrier protein
MPELTVEMAIDAVNEVLANKRNRVGQIDATVPLEALALDSLEVAELFAALEERCDTELDPDSARSLLTVGDLVRLRASGDV